MHSRILVGLAAALCLALPAMAEEGDSPVRRAGRATKEAAREVGHATRDAAKSVGHATRDAARKVGKAAKKTAGDAGKAARELRKKIAD